MILTAYRGNVDLFTSSTDDLIVSPTMFLSMLTRSRGYNPWGSTRVAAIAHLGDTFYTIRFRNTQRAFICAGKSYIDILAELEQTSNADAKLISYGDAYRCLQLPVHLLSCDDTGAVQLQIMSVPDYRRKLTQAALKNQYRPPPKDTPAWDAVFQGMPFVMAVDMDLRRIDSAIQAASRKQIAIAALRGQAETVIFPRYRDTGLARVFVLTDEAPVPYTPPRTQFITPKGDVVDAPPFQTRGKAGGSH